MSWLEHEHLFMSDVIRQIKTIKKVKTLMIYREISCQTVQCYSKQDKFWNEGKLG